MIRSEDIRSALLNFEEPLEICKVLTEKANQAGGHDNITVIVVKFDGEGLSAVTPDDEPVKYRKFGLPQSVPPNDATVRPGGVSMSPVPEASPVSEEAERESRPLRVGHTMVGMTSPLAAAPGFDPALTRSPSGRARPFEEPVDLPTTGLPPSVVGFIVVGAFLLVVAMGFWLLR
jgi:protein phosphatase